MPSTTYYYRIRAFGLSGRSDWVGGAAAATRAGPPPDAENVLTLIGSKSRGKHVIELSWTGITIRGSVDIYRDGDSLFTIDDSDSYIDRTSNKGGRSYTYQVCKAETDTCSAVENIVF